MKKIKFLALAAALVVCATASAQFSNVKRGGSSSSRSAGLESGYHAFIESGYGVGTGDVAADRIEFSTSHGYQINPYVFVGAGAGVNYYHSPDLWSVPIFANARGTLLDGPISPFLDIKIGYAAADVSGFYFSPTVGCRFSNFTLSAGYELQGADITTLYYSGYSYYTKTEKGNANAFVFKLGVEL